MPGGFVGVDVFFVISGYLISSLIAQELSAGNPAPLAEYGADYLDPKALAVEDFVRQSWSAPKVTFISPRASLCRDSGCRLLSPGNPPQPIAWDHGHLTVAGSVYFVSINAEQLLGP